MWLEHDHGGFGWAPRGVGVEVVVDLGPAGPQPLALVSLGTARTDLPCSVAGLGDGLRMSLQVQPPGGFGRTPPVHRHRDQVGSVLEVADDDLPRPPGAPADRGEPQRPPAAGLGPPQTHPAARHAQQRAMAVPEQPDEPPRRQPGPPAMRNRCPRLTIPGHNSSVKTRGDPDQRRRSPPIRSIGDARRESPASVRRRQTDRVAVKCPVEPAHSALAGVGAQHLLGEPATAIGSDPRQEPLRCSHESA